MSSYPTPLHILVAEDSPLCQRLARRLLESRGHEVTMAANGREAVNAVQTGQFDLVLMDVEMPEMNGLEATLAIREGESTGFHVPIIGVTANGNRRDCLRAGMDEFLPKPLSLAELSHSLAKVLGKTTAA